MKFALYGWTDYPIVELGDTPHKQAPVRAVEAIAYDGDKYCTAKVGHAIVSLKRGYVYRRKGRCGDVAAFSHAQMMELGATQ